jgi:hypothetical protein
VKFILTLLFIFTTSSVIAGQNCVRYKAISLDNKVTHAFIHENGAQHLVNKLTSLKNENYNSCFAVGHNNKITIGFFQVKCHCVEYSGVDEEVLATKVAEKITAKLNEVNSQNIEDTITDTYELHQSLISKLNAFIDDVLSLGDK